MIEEIKIDRLEELIHEMMIKIRDTYPTNSAEGNPIEIENAAAAPLVKCVTAITGSQDLHGYGKPWVGGAGKNKLENTATTTTVNGVTFTVNADGTVVANGTATGGNADIGLTTMTLTEGQILSGSVGGSGSTYGIGISNVGIAVGNGEHAITSGEAGSKTLYIRIVNGNTVSNVKFYPMLRASGTTATFEPYSNICQITAYSTGSVEVEDDDEQSTTYAATFTNPIYQGSIDFVAKKTTATWGYIASYDGETLPGRWISDRDEYAAGTTPTTGAEVAYELASAAVETVTVSNAPVSAVHGYNKIESSTGDMEVTYITEEFEPLVPTT